MDLILKSAVVADGCDWCKRESYNGPCTEWYDCIIICNRHYHPAGDAHHSGLTEGQIAQPSLWRFWQLDGLNSRAARSDFTSTQEQYQMRAGTRSQLASRFQLVVASSATNPRVPSRTDKDTRGPARPPLGSGG